MKFLMMLINGMIEINPPIILLTGGNQTLRATYIIMEHISSSCEGNDPLPLFRGQANYEWLVDSTLVRNSIEQIFNVPNYHKLSRKIRQSVSFHRTMTSIILLKFGTVWNPSQEAIEREKIDDIDPWFELLKHLQQYRQPVGPAPGREFMPQTDNAGGTDPSKGWVKKVSQGVVNFKDPIDIDDNV